MKIAANFLQVKICSNGMIGIQDLVYARKAILRTSDPRIIDEMNCDAENFYLKALIGIVVKLMCKEMYVEVYKR